MTPLETAQEVIAQLRGYRVSFASELELQESIAEVLRDARLPFVREATIGAGDRIDFLVADNVGLEVKIKGTLPEVTRQLFRYTKSEKLEVVVLVTTRAQHNHQPPMMNGKPVLVLPVGTRLL